MRNGGHNPNFCSSGDLDSRSLPKADVDDLVTKHAAGLQTEHVLLLQHDAVPCLWMGIGIAEICQNKKLSTRMLRGLCPAAFLKVQSGEKNSLESRTRTDCNCFSSDLSFGRSLSATRCFLLRRGIFLGW